MSAKLHTVHWAVNHTIGHTWTLSSTNTSPTPPLTVTASYQPPSSLLAWGAMESSVPFIFISLVLVSLQDKLKFILQATFQHARNLALLTTIYKVVTLLFKQLTGSVHPLVTFIGAFAGGYFVFGENNKINMQVSWGQRLYMHVHACTCMYVQRCTCMHTCTQKEFMI